jgi:hypothetical protein
VQSRDVTLLLHSHVLTSSTCFLLPCRASLSPPLSSLTFQKHSPQISPVSSKYLYQTVSLSRAFLSSHLTSLTESLVHDLSVQSEGSFTEDLSKLRHILDPHVPAFVLARTDQSSAEWVAIHYVPDAAKVRDKVSNISHMIFFVIPETNLPHKPSQKDVVCIYTCFAH